MDQVGSTPAVLAPHSFVLASPCGHVGEPADGLHLSTSSSSLFTPSFASFDFPIYGEAFGTLPSIQTTVQVNGVKKGETSDLSWRLTVFSRRFSDRKEDEKEAGLSAKVKTRRQRTHFTSHQVRPSMKTSVLEKSASTKIRSCASSRTGSIAIAIRTCRRVKRSPCGSD